MRGYPLTAAILAASFCVLPVRVPSAEDIHQPKGAPPASADANYNEDAWQTILPYQNVLGVLGKDVRFNAARSGACCNHHRDYRRLARSRAAASGSACSHRAPTMGTGTT